MAETRAGSLIVLNAVVFDGVSPELSEGWLRAEDGVVVETGTGAPPEAATEVPVLDARGGVVLPGMIDAHFHAYGFGLDMFRLEHTPLSYVALAAARRLGSALQRGFTTVRDVAGGDAGLAAAVGDGLLASPRYLWTGPALSQTGGHGDARPGDLDLCACSGSSMCEVVDGVDRLRAAVRDRFRRGAHAVKIMASGGVVSPTDPIAVPQYSPEEVRAVTEEAARRGSYVAAHAYSPESITHAVSEGVRSVEHGNLLDEPTAALMADRGAFLVPTLAAYDAMDRRGAEIGLTPAQEGKNREVLHAGSRAIELAREAGVPIGFGTDLMGALEDEQLNGLRLQVEVLGPLDGLRSVTSVNARLLGREDIGRIGVGAAADLVVLDGDPFRDPSVLWAGPDRRRVVQAGRLADSGPDADRQ